MSTIEAQQLRDAIDSGDDELVLRLLESAPGELRLDWNAFYKRLKWSHSETWEADESSWMSLRITALIRLQEYAKAIRLVDSTKSPGSFLLERAYCLYRLDELHKGLQTLDQLPAPLSEPALKLKAQLLYRLDDYRGSFDIYQSLLETNPDDSELLSNLLAVVAASEGQLSVAPNTTSQVYEGAYNMGCIHLALNDIPSARLCFTQAKQLLEKTLAEESLDDNAKQTEMAPVLAQLAYIDSLQGNASQAKNTYDSLLKLK